MFILSVLLVTCLAGSTLAASFLEKPYYELEDAHNLYRDYVKQHGKVYDRLEYLERLEIFKENLRDINRRNAKYPMTVFGINHFSDLKPEEMNQYLGLKLSNETLNNKEPVPLDLANAPDSLDWRDHHVVTHVKDQKTCGSCYIFSAIGNIEGQYAIKHKQCLALSEGQALDCLSCGSCKGGLPVDVMQKLSKRAGSEKEEDYPYQPSKNECHEDANKAVVKVLTGKEYNITDEEQLKKLLAQLGPLSVALAGDDLGMYQEGILEPDECTDGIVDHAVLLVGYGEANGKKFWIIKNSWGQDWGESGYFRLLRGVNACKMGTSYTGSATVA